MRYPVLQFSQPAGDFYLTSMPAEDVIRISRADPRTYDPTSQASVGGIQRLLSSARVSEIAEYSKTTDAAFPTAIILAVRAKDYELDLDRSEIQFVGQEHFANVVDGQHRLQGLRASGVAREFTLPVVLLLDSRVEQQALLFATINGKQTKVSASLIYDLFGITRSRSPQRTAHEIARALNASPNSPWYRRLKMLGRKSEEDSNETITQGTFVRELLPHISRDPAKDFNAARTGGLFGRDDDLIFNEYFRNGEDEVIVKILMNLFSAQREIWKEEWEDPDKFILTKTTGFMGTMWAMKKIVTKGKGEKQLTLNFFRRVFQEAQRIMTDRDLRLNHCCPN